MTGDPLTWRDLWVEWYKDGVWYGRDVRPDNTPRGAIDFALNHLQTTPDRYWSPAWAKDKWRIRLKETER